MTEGPLIDVTPHECWIASRAEPGESALSVHHPYDGSEIATAWIPGPPQLARAFAGAHAAAPALRAMTTTARHGALRRIATTLTERAEEAAELITAERATPIRLAAAEVSSTIELLHLAACYARTPRQDIHGQRGAQLVTVRPRGPVLVDATGNGTIFGVALRVAAALVVATPMVVLPAPSAPLGALLLGELLAEAELPTGTFSVLPVADREAARRLLAAEPLPVTSTVGRAPEKVAVICADWPDLDLAARRIVAEGTTRRVFVDKSSFQRALAALRLATSTLRTGDPHDCDVDVSQPVAVTDRQTDAEPATAHSIGVHPVTDLAAAVVVANRLAPRAPVGVFTRDVPTALRAAAELATTRVVVGDIAGEEAADDELAALVDELTERAMTTFAPI